MPRTNRSRRTTGLPETKTARWVPGQSLRAPVSAGLPRQNLRAPVSAGCPGQSLRAPFWLWLGARGKVFVPRSALRKTLKPIVLAALLLLSLERPLPTLSRLPRKCKTPPQTKSRPKIPIARSQSPSPRAAAQKNRRPARAARRLHGPADRRRHVLGRCRLALPRNAHRRRTARKDARSVENPQGRNRRRRRRGRRLPQHPPRQKGRAHRNAFLPATFSPKCSGCFSPTRGPPASRTSS